MISITRSHWNEFQKKYIKMRYFCYLLLLLPIIITLIFVLMSPDYTNRIFPIDGSHDYFYNGLLIIDGKLPKAHHPGTPIYYLMALIQLLVAGNVESSIQHTSIIIKTGIVMLSILSITMLYLTSKEVIVDDPVIVILSLLILYSTPPFIYNLTYFDSNFVIPVLSLAVCFLLYRPIVNQGSIKEVPLGLLLGLGMSIKINATLLILPAVAVIISKYTTRFGEAIKSCSKTLATAAGTLLILNLPGLWAFPIVIERAVLRTLFTTVLTEANTLSIDIITNSLTAFNYILIILIPSISIVTFSYLVYRKSRLRSVYKHNLELCTLFLTSAVVLLMLIDQPLGKSRSLYPMAFRQISPLIIIFVWSGVLLSTKIMKDVYINCQKLEKVSIIVIALMLVITSGIAMFDSYSQVEEEFAAAESNEHISIINHEQDRIAIPSKGLSPAVHGNSILSVGQHEFFHLHGNRKFALGSFTLKITELYPNITHTNIGLIDFSNPQSDKIQQKSDYHILYDDISEQYNSHIARTPKYYNKEKAIFAGKNQGISVDCIVYNKNNKPDKITYNQMNKRIARLSNLTEHKSNQIEFESRYGTTKFIRVCSV